MSPKEAIQILDRILDPDPWEDYGLSDKAREALQVAVEALERQVPKKATEKYDRYTGNDAMFCPMCLTYLGYRDKRTHIVKPLMMKDGDFCGRCGQKIDFGG